MRVERRIDGDWVRVARVPAPGLSVSVRWPPGVVHRYRVRAEMTTGVHRVLFVFWARR